MRIAAVLFLLGNLASGTALAGACHVLTHYHSVAHLGQARSDCENGGGTWQDQ
ncbi:hypothetical protein [Pseudomonas sp. BN417]|uniref:hypothetical protein n=1 Tax=Pseudomonas sp. BN417 TaxID=2567890 RepID=UPI0024541E0E|nr:hypothetical protein [Pseudomonas sp. BN417]